MATRKKAQGQKKDSSPVANLKQKLRLAEERIKKLEAESRTDALTGIPNRRSLDEVLKREFARARRHGTPLVVAYADLDHLKTLNSNYGHEVGDRAIVGFAKLLSSSLRSEDFCARRGGDEFVLVLPITSTVQADTLIERLGKKVSKNLRVKARNETVRMSASFGYAELGATERLRTFLGRVDADLFRWKQTRRPVFRGGG